MIDGRRKFLTKTAGALVALTGLALASPAIAGRDPIFAAIDAHREAVTAFNALNAKMIEEALIASNGAPLPLQSAPERLQAAFSALLVPAAALIDTAPTTRAGLRALERHLREDDSLWARRFIELPVTRNGITLTSRDESLESIDRLIAKRAAEISAAA
jgi:hypothetical protein